MRQQRQTVILVNDTHIMTSIRWPKEKDEKATQTEPDQNPRLTDYDIPPSASA